jgi:hypothetical protein
MRPVPPLLLGVLVVLAGCSGLPTDADQATPSATDGTTATPTESSRQTTTPAPSTVTTASPSPTTTAPTTTADPDDGATVGTADNPWGEATISVALVRNGHAETDYDAALRGALDYWESHMALADYQVGFEVVEDPADADVQVELQETVGSCGYDQGENLVGCAPLVERGTTPDRPATVRIETGFDRRSTRSVMIHEFGHVLGIEHGEPPEVYMTANNTLFTVEQPDATERAYPWSTSEFRVYVDTSGLPQSEWEGTREQVRHTVEYYNRVRDEDDDVPANVSLELVDDRAEANVVVSFPADLPCGAEEGSCGGRYGPDLDGDGAIEYYDRLNVTVGGLDTDARGWHVGYWFGRSLGIEESRLPDPFVDPTYRDIRSDWWTQSP